MSNLHAVCMATNFVGEPHELGGCIADAESWAEWFQERKAATVEMLMALDCTGNNMRNVIVSLLNAANTGDTCAFQVSMHGTTLEDGSEPDGLAEGIYPDDGDVVWDDWLRSVIASYPDIRVVVFADTCYSGGFDKALAPRRKARFVRPSLDWLRECRAKVRGIRPAPEMPANYLLHAAAMEDEEALDVDIPGGDFSGPHGAFTWAMLDRYRVMRPSTHAQWHRLACNAIYRNEYDQNPQLIGSKRMRRGRIFQ